MILPVALLVIGFIFLAKGGDFLVEGSSSFAKHFRISELVIGLTIVSLGTSAPELVVNIIASINGKTDITLGNVIGSNLCNTLLILGAAGVVAPIMVQRGTVWKEIPFALFISLLLGILLNDGFFNSHVNNRLSRGDGLILLLFFALFMYYIFTISRAGDEETGREIAEMSLSKSSLLVVIGLFGLVGGGRLVVSGAVDIASGIGVSEAMIGLTIVAIGTSLPEFFASVVAAYRGKPDIAIGNVVGSNIFNILLVLGVSSTITAIPYSNYLNLDVSLLVLSMLFVFICMFMGKRHRIERWEAAGLVLVYLVYMSYLVVRK